MKYISILILVVVFQSSFGQINTKKEIYSDYLKNHPLGSITENYHLTLTGYFDDCGEFGGHKEIILLKRENKRLVATLTIFEKDCYRRSDYEEIKIVDEKTYLISEDQVILFTNYLEKLLAKSLMKSNSFHAGRHYRARLDFQGEESEFRNSEFRDIDIHYHDTTSNWTEFDNLKKGIKK